MAPTAIKPVDSLPVPNIALDTVSMTLLFYTSAPLISKLPKSLKYL